MSDREPYHIALKRFFILIDYISKPRTIHQISRRLNISERTAYRYLETLKEAGEPVEKDENKRWKTASKSV